MNTRRIIKTATMTNLFTQNEINIEVSYVTYLEEPSTSEMEMTMDIVELAHKNYMHSKEYTILFTDTLKPK